MKTAKSITGKEFEFKQAQKTFAEFGVQYIKSWTAQELKKYRTEPVVIPYGNYGFFVGKYQVQGEQANCWRVSQHDDKVIGDFISKKTAILYCLYAMLGKHKQADELFIVDNKLGRIEQDLIFYENSLKIANKKNDKVKSAILLNRYIDAKMQRRTYQNILKKTLISAKYMNFGK